MNSQGAATTIDPMQAAVGLGSSKGPAFSARSILESARYFDLDRRQTYYDCTQHDQKTWDFDGRFISTAGIRSASQPLISGEQASWYVPLRERRPALPYRLGRIIVNAFTTLTFGEGRFPEIFLHGDEEGQDWLRTAAAAASLSSKMVLARNLGGAVGTIVLSWSFTNGKPCVEIHNAKHCFVHKWADRAELIPEHVTETYLFQRDEFDFIHSAYVRNWYWYRRDWTLDADIVFKEVLFEPKKDPIWVIDPDRSVVHNDGVCHVIWVQNKPTEDVDGEPDYHGQYEALDEIDILNSVIKKGTVLNLDPTLILKMDPDLMRNMGVKKGSDNALAVGESGDAHYMEMTGSGITAGLSVLQTNRNFILEACQCVIVDSATIAAQGVSSVALKVIYAPMTAACDIYRVQYGTKALTRLFAMWLQVARARYARNETLNLPHRWEEHPIVDSISGEPLGTKQVAVQRSPGVGGDLELVWGAYFRPTAQDLQASAGTLQVATGGKPFCSPRSATEAFAVDMGRDPGEEWSRVQSAAEESAAAVVGSFADTDGGMGGAVPDESTPPAHFGRATRIGDETLLEE